MSFLTEDMIPGTRGKTLKELQREAEREDAITGFERRKLNAIADELDELATRNFAGSGDIAEYAAAIRRIVSPSA